MNRTVGFFALASVLAALSGCGSVPGAAFAGLAGLSVCSLAGGCGTTTATTTAAAAAADVPCLNCGAQPYYAYAVSRPPMCNDYPVTYRVQIPETDERIRAVDRSELYSRDGMVTVYGGCPR